MLKKFSFVAPVVALAATGAFASTLKYETGTFEGGGRVIRVFGTDSSGKMKVISYSRNYTKSEDWELGIERGDASELIEAYEKFSRVTPAGINTAGLACTSTASNSGVRRVYLDYNYRQPGMSAVVMQREIGWISSSVTSAAEDEKYLKECAVMLQGIKRIVSLKII